MITTLTSGTGYFTSLTAATGTFANLYAGTGTLTTLNLLNQNGQSSQLIADPNGSTVISSGGLTLTAPITGTSANFSSQIKAALVMVSSSLNSQGSANFSTLAVTGASALSLSGTNLNYINLVAGTGTFVNLSSTSGTFTQLNATGAGVATLTGGSLNYGMIVGGTGAYMSLSSNTGTFVQLSAGTASVQQLNATGGSVVGLSGSALSYSTASLASLSGTNLNYINAVAGTGSFTQVNSTGASIAGLTGSLLSYSSGSFSQLSSTGASLSSLSGTSLNYITLMSGTGVFVSLRTGTGSFGSLISGTGAFTSSLSVGGTLTTQRNVLDDGQGNATFTGASLMLGSTGIATTNAAILAQNSSWQLRSTGGIATPPSGGNLFSVVSLNTGTSQLTLTQLGAVRTSNNTLDDGGGGVLINGGSFAVKNPGGTSLMVLNSNNLLSQNSVLDDGTGRLSALGCVVSRGPLTSTIASSSAQMGVQSGGLSNSVGAFVQGYASSAASALPLNLNAAGGAVYTQRNIVDDGISGNALVNGRLQFSNSATATNIAADSYGGLSVTNLASTGTSLSIVPSVPQTGFYFGDTNAGDSAVRYTGMTGGLIRLGTLSNASSLRIGGTTVRTLNNTLDDGSGNVTVSATGTLNALTLNLSQSSGNCNGWGVYNPTLPVNSTLYNYVGTTGSGNNAGYLAFQYIGAGNTGNSIGLGFQGNGSAVLRLRANSSASTQFNVLDDGSGNSSVAGKLSIGSTSVAAGTSNSVTLTLPVVGGALGVSPQFIAFASSSGTGFTISSNQLVFSTGALLASSSGFGYSGATITCGTTACVYQVLVNLTVSVPANSTASITLNGSGLGPASSYVVNGQASATTLTITYYGLINNGAGISGSFYFSTSNISSVAGGAVSFRQIS